MPNQTMMSSSILILIVAKALPLIQKQISSIHFTRISAIILLISGLLSLNILYIQSIGSGIGIYSGLFQITNISQTIEFFLLIIGSIILIGWPSVSLKQESSPNKNRLGLIALEPKPINLAKQNKYSIDYSIIVLFSILGSSLLISSLDLISFYLSLELQSFGLYILSTLYRNSFSSTNAGLKYFLLGGLSSCIILLGTGIIYAYTGLTQLESIYMLILTTNIQYVIIGTLFGLGLIIIGLLFKISAAPLHNWSPDVYDETPTIVTIWLTIIPKISLLIFILEIFTQLNIDNILINISGSFSSLAYASVSNTGLINLLDTSLLPSVGVTEPTAWFANTTGGEISFSLLNNPLADQLSNNNFNIIKNIFLISSILSLIIGTVVGLAQIKIKRLLAYSTISHIGFMLLALAINTEQSIDSFLFYLIQYIITNLNIFLILLAISYIGRSVGSVTCRLGVTEPTKTASFATGDNQHRAKGIGLADKLNIIDIKYLRDLQGLFYINPFLSLSLSLSLFSMAGIPPFIGFFSKQFVLYSAIDSGYYFISLLGIIVSVISASYYLKIIKILHTPSDLIANASHNLSVEYKAPATLTREATQGLFLSGAGEKQPLSSCPTTITTREGGEEILLSQFHSFIISILSLFILLFILKPTLILNSTQVLSLTLFKL